MMKRNAFSLMEMMVVLLITSIVAAASAPMINKKLVQGAASSNASPWVRTNQSGAIAYSFDASPGEVAMIGTTTHHGSVIRRGWGPTWGVPTTHLRSDPTVLCLSPHLLFHYHFIFFPLNKKTGPPRK